MLPSLEPPSQAFPDDEHVTAAAYCPLASRSAVGASVRSTRPCRKFRGKAIPRRRRFGAASPLAAPQDTLRSRTGGSRDTSAPGINAILADVFAPYLLARIERHLHTMIKPRRDVSMRAAVALDAHRSPQE
jgi:hypothetical protein